MSRKKENITSDKESNRAKKRREKEEAARKEKVQKLMLMILIIISISTPAGYLAFSRDKNTDSDENNDDSYGEEIGTQIIFGEGFTIQLANALIVVGRNWFEINGCSVPTINVVLESQENLSRGNPSNIATDATSEGGIIRMNEELSADIQNLKWVLEHELTHACRKADITLFPEPIATDNSDIEMIGTQGFMIVGLQKSMGENVYFVLAEEAIAERNAYAADPNYQPSNHPGYQALGEFALDAFPIPGPNPVETGSIKDMVDRFCSIVPSAQCSGVFEEDLPKLTGFLQVIFDGITAY